MPESYSALYAHMVFGTKDRKEHITPAVQTRLYEYRGGVARNDGGRLLAAGGTVDHVHLLVSLGRQQSTADFLRVVKTNSSAWIHQTFPRLRTFAWQTGYAAFSVSYSNLGRVKTCLARQAEHHGRMDFRQELETILRRHGIAFDPETLLL